MTKKSIQIKGLDEFQKNIEDLQRRANEIDGVNEIPILELMPADFMQRRTDFKTLEEMVDASGISETEEISTSPAFSQFVAAHSGFDSWDEMFQVAAQEWIQRKLGF